mgnify:CR=1 FL=1
MVDEELAVAVVGFVEECPGGIAFGFAFEIPVATVILIVAGVISPEGLAQKRPYVIVGCFVIGMVLTPPDVLSQAMLAIPMWGLFEVGVFFGRMLVRKKEGSEA